MKIAENNAVLLETAIGYIFNDKNLALEALCHSSYVNEAEIKIRSYERLEFLGDSVLSVVISKWIYEKYPKLSEGELSKLRTALVCEDALCEFAKRINLSEMILFGQGEKKLGTRGKHSIIADVFESIIAAIYLDSDINRVTEYILSFMPADPAAVYMDSVGVKSDYKTKLQEIIQKNPEEHIEYAVLAEEGPPHARVFTAAVMLNSNVLSKGQGKTKKQAEQEAAKAALSLMGLK
ncbi:MAG: ribonuclease III [Ruminococcus sp.]|jgi:ribonuclease-3|nr:ribonuclease III [Ruminococcus sp.]